MMKSRRGSRGLSPIFATLILIAIAVIAGIVVYMFTSGTIASMTGGGTAGQEKVAVQGVDTTLSVALAQNTGSTPVNIVNAIVKDASGTIISQDAQGGTPYLLAVGGVVGSVSIDLTPVTIVSGQSYTATLVSAKGGSFVSSSFIAP